MELKDKIQSHLNTVEAIWNLASDQFPDYLTEIPYDIKIQNEKELRIFTEKMNHQINRHPRIPISKKRWKKKTIRLIMNFLNQERIFGIHNFMNPKEINTFYDELNLFLCQIRRFSPELPFEEIGQALRNYIVYAMFKLMHHVTDGYHDSAFGYSMLYPFTDNYIDNIAASDKEKQVFNQLIRDTITGKPVHPVGLHHQKTYELLKMIEVDYKREQDTDIYRLLLLMLEAQEESLRQQRNNTPLSPQERLEISLYKGGVSVLIDRYLINKALSEKDYIFYLGFGFLLQLADDLQDIGEDSKNGYQTLFTADLTKEKEALLVNKLFHFLQTIMRDFSTENERFKSFISDSCYQLIYSSVMGSKEFFSEEYQRKLERCLPVTGSYLDTAKSSLSQRLNTDTAKNNIKILDDMIF